MCSPSLVRKSADQSAALSTWGVVGLCEPVLPCTDRASSPQSQCTCLVQHGHNHACNSDWAMRANTLVHAENICCISRYVAMDLFCHVCRARNGAYAQLRNCHRGIAGQMCLPTCTMSLYVMFCQLKLVSLHQRRCMEVVISWW